MSYPTSGTPMSGTRTRDRSMDIDSHDRQAFDTNDHPPPIPTRDYASSTGSEKDETVEVTDVSHEHDDVDQDTVDRALKGYHVFFISISGTLGIGLYVRSSDMLRIGGPAGVVIPFIVFTILAWMVMQCISEMLLIWPVSGALRMFVQKFVDHELGIVVAVAYWFTWALAFAALIAATADEANVWPGVDENKAKQGCGFILAGSVLVLTINLNKVRIYGAIEVIWGFVKLVLLVTLVGAMIAINLFGAGRCKVIGLSQWTPDFTKIDLQVATNWAQSFFIALQAAAFAFVGIEIPAALAVEADIMHGGSKSPPGKSIRRIHHRIWARLPTWLKGPKSQGPASKGLKFSSVWLPVWIGVAYIIAGVLVSANVASDDHNLPAVTWTGYVPRTHLSANMTSLCGPTTNITSDSGFVIAAHNAGLPSLVDATTIFLIITAYSSANTALYVASRTLYDLGRNAPAPREGWVRRPRDWPIKLMNLFGQVHHTTKVPVAAVLFSWAAFIWLPYLPLAGWKSQPQVSHDELPIPGWCCSIRPLLTNGFQLLYVLSEMGGECCVMVWACQCFAFIRFHRCIHEDDNKTWIKIHSIPYLNRNNKGGRSADYPYKSNLQPALAYLAFVGCIIPVILLPGIFALMGTRTAVVGLSSYLAPGCFLLLWIVLKFVNKGFPWGENKWFEWPDFQISVKALNDERDRGQIYPHGHASSLDEEDSKCEHCGQPAKSG